MKKHFILLCACAIAIAFSSCSKSYTKAIPEGCPAVMEINVKNIALKSNIQKHKDEIVDELLSIDDSREFRDMIKSLSSLDNSGLDLLNPVYVFVIPDSEDALLLAAVKDTKALAKSIEDLRSEFEVRETDGIFWITIDGELVGAFNKEALLVGSVKQKSDYRNLLEHKAENNFFASDAGKLMKKHCGDITVIGDFDELPREIKRELKRECERAASVYGTSNAQDALDALLEAKIVLNMEFEEGAVKANAYMAGVDKALLDKYNSSKKIDADVLENIPSRDIIGIAAFGVNGSKLEDVFSAISASMLRGASAEQRSMFRAVEDFLLKLDGTMAVAISGKSLKHEPELLCLLPAGVADFDEVEERWHDVIPRNVKIDGDKKHTAITNIDGYKYNSVSSGFEKASAANSAYFYVYLNVAELAKMAVDEELGIISDENERKVFSSVRNAVDLADYAEFKVPDMNEMTLQLYLTDDSRNSLEAMLIQGFNLVKAYNEFAKSTRSEPEEVEAYEAVEVFDDFEDYEATDTVVTLVD